MRGGRNKESDNNNATCQANNVHVCECVCLLRAWVCFESSSTLCRNWILGLGFARWYCCMKNVSVCCGAKHTNARTFASTFTFTFNIRSKKCVLCVNPENGENICINCFSLCLCLSSSRTCSLVLSAWTSLFHQQEKCCCGDGGTAAAATPWQWLRMEHIYSNNNLKYA